MECKWGWKGRNHTGRNELIDTLWNVNLLTWFLMMKWNCELIDTLWNVNSNHWSRRLFLWFGINRYIMECKLVFYDEIKKGEQAGINRYIMECKWTKLSNSE